MQTRHRIVLLTAGLLVGAQIGIAAIDTDIADTSDQMEPVPGEVQSLEAATAGEPAEAQSEATATPDESAQSSVAAAEQPIVPVTARYTGPQGTAFPASADEPKMLPSLAAYLDRTEHLRVTGASGNVFPGSADESSMLPAQVAYFERREATRLAAQRQPQIAGDANAGGASPAATPETTETIPPAQERAREVSLLDRILPQKLRDLF